MSLQSKLGQMQAKYDYHSGRLRDVDENHEPMRAN